MKCIGKYYLRTKELFPAMTRSVTPRKSAFGRELSDMKSTNHVVVYLHVF